LVLYPIFRLQKEKKYAKKIPKSDTKKLFSAEKVVCRDETPNTGTKFRGGLRNIGKNVIFANSN